MISRRSSSPTKQKRAKFCLYFSRYSLSAFLMCSSWVVKFQSVFSRFAIFKISKIFGSLFTCFMSLTNSESMFLNLVNSLLNIDLISADPKKMPSRYTYLRCTSSQKSKTTLICSSVLLQGSMSFSNTLQYGDIFMLLMLFMWSSTSANKSSHPLINLHLFWYLTRSTSYTAHISLIQLRKFSRIASPLACVNTSLTNLLLPSRSAHQSSDNQISLNLVVIFNFPSRSFQCFGFIASFLRSIRVSFTFLQFLNCSTYTSYI